MAIAAPGRSKLDRRKEFLAEARRHFLSWPFLAAVVLCLTAPAWMAFGIYEVLASFTFDPSGVIAWSALLLLGGTVILGYGTFFRRVIRHGRSLRRLRSEARCGAPGAEERIVEAKRTFKAQTNAPGLIWPHVAIWFAIPFAVALTLWAPVRQIGDSTYRYRGRLIHSTPQTRLQSMLVTMEKRGIWTPL